MHAMRRPHAERLLLIVLMSALSSPLFAKSTDREQEMIIDAAYADATLAQDSESVLKNVVISQGTLRIAADVATVTRRAGEITRVLLEGKPASLQQENDNGARMQARANRIDYDTTGESVVLTGAVEVEQGADTMRGERITYDLKNGQLNAGTEGSRIRMTIQPRPPKPEAPAKPASPEEGGTP